MKRITKNNVKKVLAAAGKFIGQKAPLVAAGAALVLPLAPLSAQEASRQGSINSNYNPVPGQITTAYIIQTFSRVVPQDERGRRQYDKENEIYILDVDGDRNTTNDQKAVLNLSKSIGNRSLTVGDRVSFKEYSFDGQIRRFVELSDITILSR